MDILIHPKHLKGNVYAIPSKSQAHRLLICAALADGETKLICPEVNQDIEATAACLRGLGADIQRTDDGYRIKPIAQIPQKAEICCGESGSTLRFLLPLAGALGIETTFILKGRLPDRPLEPLWGEMTRMGCHLSKPTANTLLCRGKLASGDFYLNGNVSSQFISGLLFAGAMMTGQTRIHIKGTLESAHYVTMTLNALNLFGAQATAYAVSGKYHLITPGEVQVEGDWSNAAFFLAANALGSDVAISNLNDHSVQGDRAVTPLLEKLKEFTEIDAANIPDLVPILSVVAAANNGAVFTHVQRLRLKESDRVTSVINMLRSLGIQAEEYNDSILVHPGKFHGGTVNSYSDHRIAMSAAIAATVAAQPVIITDAYCVSKSYPSFWKIYELLGGTYEQYIR